MKTVKSQNELDKAMADGRYSLTIEGFTAVLRGNSHAELWGNSHAELWGNSHADAYDYSVAHILSQKVKIKTGSHAKKIHPQYPSNITGWCKLKGVRIKNNRVQLWKVVREDGRDFYSGSVNYDTNKEIICPDWMNNYSQECGHGLHLADSPTGARSFVSYGILKTARLFKVSANINDCVAYGGLPDYPMKLRAMKCRKVEEFPIDYIEPF